MVFPLKHGRNPRFPRDNNRPQELAPDETFAFTLSDQTLISLKAFIEKRHPLNSLKKISIHVSEVNFDDGTFWTGGSWFRIDPGDPSKYSRLEDQ